MRRELRRLLVQDLRASAWVLGFLALISALRSLQGLPLTVDALAARLVAIALAPGAMIVPIILIAYAMRLALPATTLSVLFLPTLLVMCATQAFWVVALARRSLALLPGAALLLPMLTLPFVRHPMLSDLPPWAAVALAFWAPASAAIAVVAALALIVAAYRHACHDLRTQRNTTLALGTLGRDR